MKAKLIKKKDAIAPAPRPKPRPPAKPVARVKRKAPVDARAEFDALFAKGEK